MHKMMKNITISKLDAAKRQLETVIRLYFFDGDPVSIHTLTSAAYNVIRDVNAKKGGDPMLVKEKALEFVKPEYREEFRKSLNNAENFFKHADKDHDQTLDFNPDQSEMLIWDAISTYSNLTGETPPLFKIFQAWFVCNKPEMFVPPEEIKRWLATTGPELASIGKTGFFNKWLPVVMQMGT